MGRVFLYVGKDCPEYRAWHFCKAHVDRAVLHVPDLENVGDMLETIHYALGPGR